MLVLAINLLKTLLSSDIIKELKQSKNDCGFEVISIF